MAYQEHSTVNSHKHVIDLLETFLTAQGWTIDSSVNSTERELYVSKAHGGETFYFSVKSANASTLVLSASTAYPEAGSSGLTYANLKSTSMVRCWLFAGDLYAYLVVEVAAGYFQMLGFGRLTPYHSFSVGDKAGAFIFGNNNTAWSTLRNRAGYEDFSLFPQGTRTNHVRHVPVAGAQWATPDYSVLGYNLNYPGGDMAYRESWLLSRLRNTNGDRPMLPIRWDAPNNPVVATGFRNSYPLGYLPAMRVMSGKDVVSASEQTIGSDVWKRFAPPHQNLAVVALTAAGELSFAFLK